MIQWTRFEWLAVALAAGACGGTAVDESGLGAGGAAGESSASGTVGVTGATSAGSGVPSGAATTTSGGGGKCTAGAVNMDNPCEVCVVTSCTQEALACCQHEGCLGIIACAQMTGCTGIDCYTPDMCQKEIDAAGGPGVALEFAGPLGTCAIESCGKICGQ